MLPLSPALPVRRHVRARLLGRVRRFFLTLIPCRRKNRQIDTRLGAAPAGPSAAQISSSVRSGCASSNARMRGPYASVAPERRSPPIGPAVTLPV